MYLEIELSRTPTRGAAQRVSERETNAPTPCRLVAAIDSGRVSGRVLGSARVADLLAQ